MAGLNRLGQGEVGHPLAAEEWLPAPGQGAIAIECRTDDALTRSALAAIDHAPSRDAVMAERALLAGLGGNCHSAVAMLTRAEGVTLHLVACLFSADGRHRVDGEVRFAPGDAQAPVALAADLLARAPPSITSLFATPA